MKNAILLFLIICFGISACESGLTSSDSQVDQPEHISLDITKAKIQLGKELFNDVRLSRDNTISCASCHHKDAALSDTNRFSIGIDGQLTNRNSLPLFNLENHSSFFRDGGSPSLEMQVVSPIENPIEMDMNLVELCYKLDTIESYHQQSISIFGTKVSPYVITRSLAAYLGTFLSTNSRYDRFIRGEQDAMTAEERKGMGVFFGKANCTSCHSGGNFSDNTFQNNGLYTSYSDQGRFVITQNEKDKSKFRVQTLRNIELTPPYMHDGSMTTLAEVIDHYNIGGADHFNKSDLIKPLGLTQDEKLSLISFLKSLTDDTFTKEL